MHSLKHWGGDWPDSCPRSRIASTLLGLEACPAHCMCCRLPQGRCQRRALAGTHSKAGQLLIHATGPGHAQLPGADRCALAVQPALQVSLHRLLHSRCKLASAAQHAGSLLSAGAILPASCPPSGGRQLPGASGRALAVQHAFQVSLACRASLQTSGTLQDMLSISPLWMPE